MPASRIRPALVMAGVVVACVWMLVPATALATAFPPSCFGYSGSFELGKSRSAGGCLEPPDQHSLHLTITQAPTKGSAVVIGQDSDSASVSYTASQTGQDTLKFKASDGGLESGEVTVTITNVPNASPTCVGGFGGSVQVGQTATEGSCVDLDEASLHLTITQAPSKGTAEVIGQDTSQPSVRYTASVTGQDTLKFKASDGNSDSDEVTVTTDNVPNVPPTCSDDSGTFEMGEPTVAGTCLDYEGDDLHITITQAPTKGTAEVIDQDTPDAAVAYTASETGQDTLRFKARDANSDSNEVTVTTDNVPNVSPTCFDDSNVFELGEPTFAGTCSDVEDDDLHITITQAPTKGTVDVIYQDSPAAGVVYTATQAGPDTFKFKASDGNSESNEATITTNNYSTALSPPRSAPPPAVIDHTPPACTAGGRKSQKVGKTVRVSVSCPAEAASAIASATVHVPRVGTVKAKLYTLKPAGGLVVKAGTATLKPTLPDPARQAIKRALHRGRVITVKLKVTVADAAGNARTLTRQIKLRS